MSDITKCTNTACPMADMCWRFVAPHSHFNQSYAKFEPDEDGECDKIIWIDEVEDE